MKRKKETLQKKKNDQFQVQPITIPSDIYKMESILTQCRFELYSSILNSIDSCIKQNITTSIPIIEFSNTPYIVMLNQTDIVPMLEHILYVCEENKRYDLCVIAWKLLTEIMKNTSISLFGKTPKTTTRKGAITKQNKKQ